MSNIIQFPAKQKEPDALAYAAAEMQKLGTPETVRTAVLGWLAGLLPMLRVPGGAIHLPHVSEILPPAEAMEVIGAIEAGVAEYESRTSLAFSELLWLAVRLKIEIELVKTSDRA